MRKKRNNKNGQVTLEMALLILVMLGMTKIVQKWAGDIEIEIFERFLIEPWKQVRVMTESGVWGETNLANGRAFHPAQRKRLFSSVGEEP